MVDSIFPAGCEVPCPSQICAQSRGYLVSPQVRVWDVRRSGCVAVVDQHDAEAHPATVAMPPLNDRCSCCPNPPPVSSRRLAELGSVQACRIRTATAEATIIERRAACHRERSRRESGSGS